MLRPCLGTGSGPCPTRELVTGSRCEPCQRAKYKAREQARPMAQRITYHSTAWKRLARAVVDAASECAWCHVPAWRAKLTADHILRVVDRPDLALDPSNVVAACRSCQERRKYRPDVSMWAEWERRPQP